jgi:D-alanine-D-alanine ligase-like ATP-grasp enzyme
LTSEPDVLDLARRAHAAVPEIPSLGIDIVREEGTGALYVLEINPGGQAWILTNDSGIEMQAQFGFDFYPQFNALDVIADRSIEIARTYAS